MAVIRTGFNGLLFYFFNIDPKIPRTICVPIWRPMELVAALVAALKMLPNTSVRTPLVYIDGKEYEDLLQSVNDYFVPREKNQPWRWGLDEEMPEEVTVSNYDKDSTYALKYGKIYRATDFVKDYESYQAAKK